MRAARYLILSLLFFIFYFLFVSVPVSAQSYNNPATVKQSQYAAPNTNPDVPRNLHTYTQSVTIEVMSALTCQLAGVDPTSPSGKCLGVDPKTGNIGFVEGGGGAIGVMSHMIAAMYTPPVHTVDYIANLAQNFGIAKHTYAASNGIGFAGISPLIGLWSTFRNIVYLLFVLVFVAVGVAIMLRIRIDPRTVMTIQNQIPKLVIGILLVTFSFAIAGFLIDAMYIAIYLIFNIFGATLPNLYTSPFGVAQGTFNIFNIAFKASYSIGAIVSGLTDAIFSSTIGYIMKTLILFLLGGPVAAGGNVLCTAVGHIPNLADIPGLGFINHIPLIGSLPLIGGGGPECNLLENLPQYIIGGLTGIIAFLVIMIAILWALFRLWFTLLSAYVMILIDIVFAPFWIVAGLFPGGSAIGFTSWLRSLVANLAAFPAAIVMFLLGMKFMEIFGKSGGNMFVPPLIGNPNAADRMGAIIGLGIILTTPNVVNMLRSALKAPKFDLSAAGAAIGAGTGVPTKTVSQAAGIYTAATFNPYDQNTRRAALGRVFQRLIR